MLEDPRPYVRQASLFALQTLLKTGQDRGHLARLAALMEDSSPDVRNEAAQVLGRLRMPAALDALSRKGLSDPSPLVRTHSAMALGNYGPEATPAIAWLVEALRDPETGVVESAWWALKKVSGLDYDRSYYLWRDWYEQDQKRFEYFCPNHPAVIRETAGFCPDCGRSLERQPKAAKPKESPALPDTHVCPTHPEVTGREGGKCGKCKEDLVPRK